jgi:hypothetical protein
MTDYTSLGAAIKTTFEADAWLGNVANVKTIEVHKRGFKINKDKDSLYMDTDGLPGIIIIPNMQPKGQNQTTTNEIEEIIKSQVITLTRHRKLQVGMNAHFALVANVERVLQKQKSSADDLGIDAFVRSVSTEDNNDKEGDYYYFTSQTSAEIELTATF